MSNLTIVAHIKAKPNKVELVKSELEKLITITRGEAGCIQYDLHQNNQDATEFMFYETWASYDLWQKHINNAHLKAFTIATEGAIDHVTVNEMTHIA
ncbi:antibiotic biosynthesis monooxygenase [Thiotrichales bacterium 19S3-7]|nr:antibiotic biosynthesis monooxygenase [Thiotrichales bacterium 19S3-7]MCF6800617.1 antibiotic biosynthesis monooxygenase [Thiotrichales bacterium 19S3-11]